MNMYEIILDIIEKNGPVSFSSICAEMNQIHPIKNERNKPVLVSQIKSVVSRKKDLFSVNNEIVSIREDMDFISLSVKVSSYKNPCFKVEVDFIKNRFNFFEWYFHNDEVPRKPRTIYVGSVERFKKEIYRLKLWNWERDYHPEILVLDGTTWSVELRTKGSVYHSSGLQTFPKEWTKFTKALSRLTGVDF